MSSANSVFKKVLSKAGDATKSASGFMGLLTDNTITLKNLLLSAVVVGLELLLSSQLFDCPLQHHTLYGLTFLLAPVFIVFITNVLLIADVWRVSDRVFVERYRRCCDFGFWVLPNVVKAFVGPAVWLVAALADGTYYVCAAVGPDSDKRNLTNATEIKEELEAELAVAKTKSHLWAFLVLAFMVIVTALVMTTKKCCLKDNVLLEDDYVLERREAVAALLYFRHFIEHPHHHGDLGNEGNGSGQEDKVEDKDVIKGRFMGKEEEIALYPEGIPEQCGKKSVEKFFRDCSVGDGSFCYEKAYEKFVERYPRIANGNATYAWVVRSNNDATDGEQYERQKKQYSRIPKAQTEAVSAI